MYENFMNDLPKVRQKNISVGRTNTVLRRNKIIRILIHMQLFMARLSLIHK